MRYCCFFLCLIAHGQLIGALKPETVREFDQYQAVIDEELSQRLHGLRPFLWIEEQPDKKRLAEQGQVLTYSLTGQDGRGVTGGLVHDWVGDMYLRGVKLEAVRKFLMDTDHHAGTYPEVKQSKVLSRDGNRAITKLRLVKKKVLTVVLDIEYRNEWQQPSPDKWTMSARSQKVVEVEDAGSSKEKALPPDTGHGFLWRMNSQWALRQDPGGVWVELRSVSLSRDTPHGLGWIIRPMIRNFPSEAIQSTLDATKRAVTAGR